MKRSFFLLAALLASVSVPGIFFHLLSFPFYLAIATGILIGLGCLGFGFASKSTKDREETGGSAAWAGAGLLSGCVLLAVASQGSDGLFNIHGMDPATQLALFHRYFNRLGTGLATESFVVFFGAVGLFHDLFRLDWIQSISAALYVSTFLFLAIACLAQVAGLAPFTKLEKGTRIWWLALNLFCFFVLTGPLIYYQIGEGFWLHLTSVAPLIMGLMSYTVLHQPYVRLGAVAAWILVYRFSYGINAADFVLCFAGLLAWEAHGSSQSRFKKAAWVAAGLSLVTAIWGYRQLWEVFFIDGAVARHDLKLALVAQVGELAALIGILRLVPKKFTASKRYLRFILAFTLVIVVMQAAFLALGLPRLYYFYKYATHSTFLFALSFPMAVWVGFAAGAKNATYPSFRDCWAPAMLILAFGLSAYSYRVYSEDLNLLLAKKKPETPGLLFSRSLSQSIDEILVRENKRYRITLGLAYQPLRFLNTYKLLDRLGQGALKFQDHQFEVIQTAPEPNECIFWIGDSPYSVYPEVARLLKPVSDSIQYLQSLPAKKCEKGQDDFTQLDFDLCYVCGS